MSMPKAARQTDPISHSSALAGLLAGLVIGAAIGAFVVLTGGAGAVAIGAVLSSACVAGSFGASIGQMVGGAIRHTAGHILLEGKRTVLIGKDKLPAARAKIDKVDCDSGMVIAQGSRIVFIENFPASRVDDKTECDGDIEEGWPNVEIGKEPATYVKIKSEVPLWLEIGVIVLGLLPGLVKGAVSLARMAAARGWIKCPGGASKLSTWISEILGHPVNVATGDVVDRAIEFSLPGTFPLVWERNYCSAQASEEGPLGCGGWTHSLDQWIVEDEGIWSFRNGEGRDIYFEKIAPGQSTFHRRERLTLRIDDAGNFQLRDVKSGLTRHFGASQAGDRAYLQRISDGFGNDVRLYYDHDRLVRVVDTAGRRIHVDADERGRIIRLEIWAHEELQQWTDYGYHVSGELAFATNSLGFTDWFEYDAQHQMTKTTLKNGVSFYYAYDTESGRCIRTWGDGGLHNIELSYDLDEGKTIARGTSKPAVYYWDATGRVRRKELLDGTCVQVVETDDDGYVIAEGVNDAQLRRYEYDERGNRTKEVDEAGNVTTWVFDGDKPIRRIAPDDTVTSYEHGEKAEIRAVTYPTGIKYSLGYDLHGRLVTVRNDDRAIVAFEYDGQHNAIRELDARNASTTFAFDAMGRPIERVDALGRTTKLEYDRIGQVIAIHAPDGTTSRAEYEPLGNMSRTIDALGQITELEYAGTGVLARLVQPDGGVWAMQYDQDEQLREIRNPNEEIYAFEYNDAGKIISEQTFDGRKLRYQYDAAGRVSTVHSPDAGIRLLKYDALGNVINDRSFRSNIEFTRDKLGRLSKALIEEQSGRVITEFQRDEFGRVIDERQNGKSIRFAYDAHGRRIERILPNGSTTRYGYDGTDALSFLEHEGKRFSLERDVIGREISLRSVGGGVEIRSAYDEMDRLVERHVVGGAAHAALTQRTWKYDAVGRVREIGDSRWGATFYQYDRIGQLIEAKRGAHHEVFHYDITGSLRNILQGLTNAESGRPWDTEPGNLLTRTDTATYEYDACGRRIKKRSLTNTDYEKAGEITTYEWDDRDRLREVKKHDGTRVRFTYDAFGRRVQKEVLAGADAPVKSRLVEFIWDGDELAADVDSTRGARVFVHKPGTFVPVLQAEQGEVFSVVNDHLGMPKELVDHDGRVAWSASHSAWGRVLETYGDPSRKGPRVESPFRLLGQYADDETGLCYTRFRYFDAETGRWCSPDPLGIVGGVNLHQFDGAPGVHVDPLGLECAAKLATALEAAGHARPVESAAHHIVSRYSKGAAEARQVLTKFGIGLDEAANGVFLPATKASVNPLNAAVHSTVHTKAYYQTVNKILTSTTSRQEALDALAYIQQKLLQGGL